MAMNTMEGANAPGKQSLMADAARLCARLADLRVRATNLADTLHGPVPLQGSKDDPELPPTLRRNIDTAHALLSFIEDELGRATSRL